MSNDEQRCNETNQQLTKQKDVRLWLLEGPVLVWGRNQGISVLGQGEY